MCDRSRLCHGFDRSRKAPGTHQRRRERRGCLVADGLPCDLINDHPRVKPSTRERVLAAIDEPGFRRNATALALAGGRTRAVTVLSADTTHYGYASILRGVEEGARAASYAIGIVLESADEASVAAEVKNTRSRDDYGTLGVPVDLKKGANKVTTGNAGARAPNIDRIEPGRAVGRD